MCVCEKLFVELGSRPSKYFWQRVLRNLGTGRVAPSTRSRMFAPGSCSLEPTEED